MKSVLTFIMALINYIIFTRNYRLSNLLAPSRPCGTERVKELRQLQSKLCLYILKH